MWYADAFKFNELYSPELHSGRDSGWQKEWASDDRVAWDCRVHGTPLFDTMSVCWLASVENRRSELDPKYLKEGGLFDVQFKQGPTAEVRAEGLHMFDIDDPELVEMGEERIHERLTSHLAGLYEGAAPADIALDVVTKYMNDMMMHSIDLGHPSVGLIMEVFRQRALGLPYSWWGAPVDD